MKYFMKICDFADEEASWINALRLSRITFVNKKPLGASGAFVAASLTIYFEPDTDDMEFSNLIHELRHAWQYKTMRKVKYFLCKAFMRKKLEDDAWEWEEKAINWWKEREVAK